MARITADLVIDEQLDRIYEQIMFLVSLHSPDGEGICPSCKDTSPCWTLEALNKAQAEFVQRPQEEGLCRD